MCVLTPRSVYLREGRVQVHVWFWFTLEKKEKERHLACSFSVGNCNKPLFLNPITLWLFYSYKES